MKELIEFIAKALVDNPEAISISEDEDADGTILVKLAAAQEDMGASLASRGARLKPCAPSSMPRPPARTKGLFYRFSSKDGFAISWCFF